ncbi:MAG: hypothetical protein NXI13_10000 [Proteobacteria bacterium]|nr:hypothetical protein [Pseudomonadota bacterium]
MQDKAENPKGVLVSLLTTILVSLIAFGVSLLFFPFNILVFTLLMTTWFCWRGPESADFMLKIPRRLGDVLAIIAVPTLVGLYFLILEFFSIGLLQVREFEYLLFNKLSLFPSLGNNFDLMKVSVAAEGGSENGEVFARKIFSIVISCAAFLLFYVPLICASFTYGAKKERIRSLITTPAQKANLKWLVVGALFFGLCLGFYSVYRDFTSISVDDFSVLAYLATESQRYVPVRWGVLLLYSTLLLPLFIPFVIPALFSFRWLKDIGGTFSK